MLLVLLLLLIIINNTNWCWKLTPETANAFRRSPLSTVNAGGICNSSDGCYLFDHCAGRNATSLIYWLPICMGRLRGDGQCCGWEPQCGRRTKTNWTKNHHRTFAKKTQKRTRTYIDTQSALWFNIFGHDCYLKVHLSCAREEKIESLFCRNTITKVRNKCTSGYAHVLVLHLPLLKEKLV